MMNVNLVFLMRAQFIFYDLLLIGLLFFFSIQEIDGKNQFEKPTLKASNGIIFLNSNDIEKGVSLDGEWEFYWQKLYEPQDFYFNNTDKPSAYFTLPAVWNGFKLGEEILDGHGYATYRLQIKTKDTDELLALDIPAYYCSYKLWVNGVLLSQNGIVGTSEETSKAQWIPLTKAFHSEPDIIEIIIQISNFQHTYGGLYLSPIIGTYENLSVKRERNVAIDVLLFGCLVLIGLFFLGMFLFWRKDKSLIYFSLFCIIISYRFIGTGTYMIINIFPDFNWQIATKLEYLSLYLGVFSMFMFIKELFEEATSEILLRILKIITLFVVILTIFFPVGIFSRVIVPYQVVLLFYLFYGGFVFIVAYKRKYEGAIFAIISISVMLTVAAIASLSYLGYLPVIPFIFGFGFLVFVFSQSFILSFRFAKSFHQIEGLRQQTMYQKLDIEEKHQELVIQKEEILQQKEEIIAINEAVNEKNEQIMSSIRYAQGIQSVILPNTKLIKKFFPDSFIYNQPRDVVSGDFPWFLQKGDDLYIAAVDCTGHGVPGAFISLIGYFILNGIVNSDKNYEAGVILDKLNEGVTSTLKRGVSDIKGDGMDIGLAHINLEEGFIEYAGAHRPLYYVRNNQLEVIKGDKFPVGGEYEQRKNFHTVYLDIQKGDSLYLFSDGLPDQFGGEKHRKFSARRMRELIMDNNGIAMIEMKNIFMDAFESWKRDAKQTDDILIIGLKL